MTESATLSFHDARNPMLLSYSGIATYLTCRERWKLQNVYGLKSRGAVSKPMDVGSAVHAGIEHVLKGKGPYGEGVDLWVAEARRGLISFDDDELSFGDAHLTEVREQALQIGPRVFAEIDRRGLKSVRIGGRALVEEELTIALEGWDGFASHIDWIAQDPHGRVWIVDFKTRKTFYGIESEEVNLQNPIYQRMLYDVYGIEAAGTLTFQVRSQPMSIPKQTKTGISRAAIVCDWDTYREAVIAIGQDPADYADMRAKLSTVKWTEVIEAYRSKETVDRIWEGIVLPTAFEMSRIRDRLMSTTKSTRHVGARQVVRNLSPRTCDGCNVRDVCLSSLKGHDPKSALSSFRVKAVELVDHAIAAGHL